MKRIALCLLWPLFLTAQTPSTPTKTAAAVQSHLAHVEGKVVDSVTGNQLAKVQLTMTPHFTTNGTQRYTTTTDAKGMFTMDDVIPGLYSLRAERPGFTTRYWGTKGRALLGTPLSVPDSGNVKDILFKLEPQGVISGRVVDEDGDPLQGASVEVLRYGYFMPNGPIVGGRRLLPLKSATTNELGEYRIPDLPPNTYFVRAIPKTPLEREIRQATGPGGVEERHGTFYFPRSRYAAGAAGTPVGAGADVRAIDVHLQKVPVYHIRGRAIGPTG